MEINRRSFIRNLAGGTAGITLAGYMNPANARPAVMNIKNAKDDSIKRIYLSFKAHWDIGFTTSARKLTHNIINWHFPTVMNTAKQLKDSNEDQKLVVTFGSWMIYEGLEKIKGENLKNLEKAIAEDVITWNAMPFTMHRHFPAMMKCLGWS